MKNETVKSPSPFEKIADIFSKALESTAAFVIAFFILIVWFINPLLTILISGK
jgi:low affinity Fe/Cu permease